MGHLFWEVFIPPAGTRIAGNLSDRFPEKLADATIALLQNTDHKRTGIRWARAYALSRVITIPQYAKSPLFDRISDICAGEEGNGVKNQCMKALKKAEKIR